MLVIDASAALYAAASKNGFSALRRQELVAPALLWSECSSVLSEMCWRREISDELASETLDRILGAPIARRFGGELYRASSRLASQLGWAKTYDAEYVALAHMLGVSLLTRDAKLQRGVRGLVRVVGPDEV